MPRSGVLIYFDILPAMEKLNDQQAGALFRGVLLYARDGIMPSYADPMVDLMWRLMRGPIDRDDMRYEESVKSNRYSTYCRECKKRSLDPGTHEDWMLLNHAEIDQLFSHLRSERL